MLTTVSELPTLTSTHERSLSCTVLSDVGEVDRLRPQWLNLLERAERSELTQSPEWLHTWWSVFGNLHGRTLRLGVFHEDDRLVGWRLF